MERITQKDLEHTVNLLNDITGNNRKAYSADTATGKLKANIGTYCLDGAYGGWKLAQITNEGGGQRDLLNTGYTTKRNLYRAIRSFIAGIETVKRGEV